jgi:predicted O-methyltransferase YrrM
MTPGFTEDWFSPESQAALAECARRVADVDGDVIEIGCWEGRSSVCLANTVYPRTVHCVDTWRGSPDDVSSVRAAERDVHAQWAANVAAMTQGNVVEHRMGWRDFVPSLTGPVALAFIDAEHTYREVYDNVVALRPLMASGGIMCGDDIGHPPVRQAVTDLFGDMNVWVKASLWIWVAP